ncbi:MAG: hypothetical protein A6F71_10085 [Cycloclasticus sp. symbiont of Poecilosclerida sp. M]|nr:MAG: hypothetical protein A6F71_10085 [Cycloclasticus sp. symbiont of Poecilosclerida sp. M]
MLGSVQVTLIAVEDEAIAVTPSGADGAVEVKGDMKHKQVLYYTAIVTQYHKYIVHFTFCCILIVDNLPSSSVLAVTGSLCAPSATVNACTKIV